LNTIEMQKHIFGSIFLAANRLQVLGDQYLSQEDLTTKQWFLNVMIAQFSEKAPTLSEVAELVGNSRQNVKQLALKLDEKGFLTIEKDEQDARALRLKLTEKSREFWEERQKQDNEYIARLFEGLTQEELQNMCKGFGKLIKKIEELEQENKRIGVIGG